jgi:hypothetical protein
MSITVDRPNVGHAKHARAYIGAICGIALAVSAGVVLASQESAPTGTSQPKAAAIPITPRDEVIDHYIFYLVESVEERDAWIARAMGDDFITPRTSFVIVREPKDEFSVAGTQAELTSIGHIAEVVDLRGRLTP